jgi:hypothetical protein
MSQIRVFEAIHGGIDSFCILPFDLLGDADELLARCIIFVKVISAAFVAVRDRSVVILALLPEKYRLDNALRF